MVKAVERMLGLDGWRETKDVVDVDIIAVNAESQNVAMGGDEIRICPEMRQASVERVGKGNVVVRQHGDKRGRNRSSYLRQLRPHVGGRAAECIVGVTVALRADE